MPDGVHKPRDTRWGMRAAATFLGHIRHALVVDSASKAAGWLTASALAAANAAGQFITQLAPSELAAGLLAVGLAIPPAVGVVAWWVRARLWDKRKRYYEALDRATLSEAELRDVRADLITKEAELQETKVERDEATQIAQLAVDVLRDAHGQRLLQSPDPHRAFERWLSREARKVLRVVFRQPEIGIGIFRFWPNLYDLVYDVDVPEEVARLAPARATRSFADCVKRHAPYAKVFHFPVEGEDHWLVVFPKEQAAPHWFMESILGALAQTISAWLISIRQKA